MGKFSWMALYLLQLYDWRYFIKSWMVICEASRIQTSRSVWQYPPKNRIYPTLKGSKEFHMNTLAGILKIHEAPNVFFHQTCLNLWIQTGPRCCTDDFPPPTPPWQGGWAPGKDFRWDFLVQQKAPRHVNIPMSMSLFGFPTRWPGCVGHQLKRFYSKIPTHIERCATGALHREALSVCPFDCLCVWLS